MPQRAPSLSDSENNISHGLTITDEKGIFVYVNETYSDMLGYSSEELVGNTPFDFTVDKDIHILHEQMKLRFQGKTTQYRNSMVRKDGSLIEVLVTGVPIERNGVYDSAISVITDWSNISETNLKMQRKQLLLRKVSQALNVLVRESDTETAINEVLRLIGEASGVDRVYIFENFYGETNQPDGINQRFEWSAPGIESQIDNPELQNVPYEPYFSAWLETLSQGKTYGGIVRKLATPEEREILEMQEILSILVIPIFVEGNYWGFVGFDDVKMERNWEDDEEALLLALASSVGGYLERQIQRSALQQQKTFFETVLNSIPSDLVVFNPDHSYRFINPMAISDPELREWLIGKTDWDYIKRRNLPKSIAEERAEKFAKTLELRERYGWDERVVRPGLPEKWVFRNLKPIYDDHDNLEMVIGYGLDITQRVKQNEELVRAREEALESQRVKQRFLAKVSHEIRTPMNGVIGVTNLLETTPLDNAQQEYVNILQESGAHLVHLINDILDISKMEEGNFQLMELPFNLKEIVNGAIQAIAPTTKDKKLRLITDIQDQMNTSVLGDPVRMRQVFLNLLNNAAKFTMSGFIRIQSTILEESLESLKVRFTIQDTGIGIKKEYQNKIFKVFESQNATERQQFGGAGMGLAITHELIQQMGGTIHFESNEGEGTTFFIELKFSKTDKNTFNLSEANKTEISPSIPPSTRILIVDDHAINRTVAGKIIENWGISTDFAENGAEAISKLYTQTYDLILMDMQMPVMDGIQATKTIRNSGTHFANIPIIAMTAAALPQERQRCLNSGMNEYLAKPFDPKRLQTLILSFLSTKEVAESTEVAEQIEAQTSVALEYDLAYLNELSTGNEDFIMEMLQTFRDDFEDIKNQIGSALDTGNLIEASRLAHKGKSLASYIGAKSLNQILITLENNINDLSADERKAALNQIESHYTIIISQLKQKYTL